MKLVRILILEDDLLTLSKLCEKLRKLEDEKGIEFSVMVLSEYLQVEKYINESEDNNFDIILLDRDCKLSGSFHILNFNKLDANKIISISSVPAYNQEAQKKGINKIVLKEYDKLDIFVEKVAQEIFKLI